MPTWTVAPFFLFSFVLLSFQYFRVNPDRRLLNLRFAMMAGGITLLFLQIFNSTSQMTVVLFGLGVVWFGVAIVLARNMPPPRH